MKLFLLVVLFSLGGCGGESFVSEAISVSPDSGAFVDAQGLPTTDGTDRREAAGPVAPDSLSPGETEVASRDVLADPWPADVTVEPMPDGPPATADATSDALVCHNPPCRDPVPCLNCFYVGPDPSRSWTWACCQSGNNIPGGKCVAFEPAQEYGYCGNCGC